MDKQGIVPAIWTEFTPYLIPWAERQFGCGIYVNQRPVLELRPIKSMYKLLRQPVEECLSLDRKCGNSLSQLDYDVCIEREGFVPRIKEANDIDLDRYLPVHVPDYMITTDGVIRGFSRVMCFSHKTANKISHKVYEAFWFSVHTFALCKNDSNIVEMIEAFIDENGLPLLFLDELARQYRRMCKQGFFAKVS